MSTNLKEKLSLSLFFDKEQIDIIKEFFGEIIEATKEYDLLVLTTRRCFCFFYSLIPFFDLSEKEIALIKEKVLSSQAIDVYCENLKEKNILLCDDIMIHGQSVYHLYKAINSYSPQKTDVLLMLRNIEKPDYFKIKTSHDYRAISLVSYTDWRRFSNSIVRFIHSTGCLYISYVYGYRIPQNECNNLITSKNCFEKLMVRDDLFAHEYYYDDNSEPEYYYVNDFQKLFNNDFDFKYINYATLRFYKIPNNSDCWVIPYFELKDLSCQQLGRVFKELGNYNAAFKKIKSDADRYKALTAIVSILMSKELIPSALIKGYTEYIDKSYFEGFYNSIQELQPRTVFELLEQNLTFQVDSMLNVKEQEAIMYNQLLESFNVDQSEIELEFKKYFAIINKKEEDSFQELIKLSNSTPFFDDFITDSNKFLPIRIYDLQKKVLSNYTQNDYIKNVLYFMDSGAISLVSKTFGPKSDYVGVFAKAGEQSYHLFADIAGVYYTAFYYVYSYIKNHIKGANNQKEFINKFLNTIESSYSNHLDVELFRYLFNVNFKSLESYYFGLKNTQYKKNISKEDSNNKLMLVCQIIRLCQR
ncbi:MAG: hypothetical protein U0M02_00460 [Acutalibacteraceae bacterium]|nr:hypothetical protein [Acutalibacteraceae bacterium]